MNGKYSVLLGYTTTDAIETKALQKYSSGTPDFIEVDNHKWNFSILCGTMISRGCTKTKYVDISDQSKVFGWYAHNGMKAYEYMITILVDLDIIDYRDGKVRFDSSVNMNIGSVSRDINDNIFRDSCSVVACISNYYVNTLLTDMINCSCPTPVNPTPPGSASFPYILPFELS